MPRGIRRVVTGHDAEGKAVILMDGDAPNVAIRPNGLASTLIWVTDEAPAKEVAGDAADRETGITPPKAGSILRVLEMPPQAERTAAEIEQAIAESNRLMAENPQPGIQRSPSARALGMHRTASIDYALVLEGEIDLLVDEDETHLTTGDIVVMQGTNHSWANRSGKITMMAFVLVGADLDWE